MAKNKITSCPKCSKKIRVPIGKHIKFICPACKSEFDYDDSLFLGEFKEKKKKTRIYFVAFLSIGVLVGIFNYYKTKQDNKTKRYRALKEYYQNKKIKSTHNNLYRNYNKSTRIKKSLNNRSNQMNPNNSAYGSSRNGRSGNRGQSRSSMNNRSNQMNPNNSTYGSSRNSGGRNQGQSRLSMNNRSNQMNPNNSSYKGGKR